MKNLVIASIIIVVSLNNIQCNMNKSTERRITVSGTAEENVTADIIKWKIEISTQNNVLEKAAETNKNSVQEVADFLKPLLGDDKELIITNCEFDENWKYERGSRFKIGYYAKTYIMFSNKNMESYYDIWMGLSRIDNVKIDKIDYDYSKRTEIQNRTRKEALQKAMEKAESLAGTLGCHIGKVIDIYEDLSADEKYFMDGPYNIMLPESRSPKETTLLLSPDKITIKTRVKAIFELQ
ncbi:MAG: SIMPL domain-containing protein [Chitinispirillaceae bacterium]|nr:SIMPL domain-containing protein [Chitinispirillaceae bacterium]